MDAGSKKKNINQQTTFWKLFSCFPESIRQFAGNVNPYFLSKNEKKILPIYCLLILPREC